MRQSTVGKLYLASAFSLAGTSVMTGYLLSSKLSGFTMMAASMAMVLLCLLPAYGGRVLRTMRRLTRRDWLLLVCQAVFGIVLFRIFVLLGVRNTSTAEAGMLTGVTPAITAVLAFFFLKEKLSTLTVAGISATVIGIVFLQGYGLRLIQFSTYHTLGNALMLCAAASESIFNIISRKHRSGERQASAPIHPMVQTLLVSLIAFFLCLVPALTEHPVSAISALAWQEWLALVWYGVVVTALAFALFYAGAKRCGAYTIAAFSGMMPLTSVLLSVSFLHECITLSQWLGGAMILLGMALIGQKNRRKPC